MTTGQKRLLELARFLRERVTNKLFDFQEVMFVGDKKPKDALKAGGGCGTVGCAMGWADVRWPGKGLISDGWFGSYAIDDNVAEFFGITTDEVAHLFYPGVLPDTATRLQVAKHIEKFVTEVVKKQELLDSVLKQVQALKKLRSFDMDELYYRL